MQEIDSLVISAGKKPVPKPRTTLTNKRITLPKSTDQSTGVEFSNNDANKPPLLPRSTSLKKLPSPIMEDQINLDLFAVEDESEPLEINDYSDAETLSPPADPRIRPESQSSTLSSIATSDSSRMKLSKSDGEAICFSGWVRLLMPKKIQRCWALIRDNKLAFYQNEEVLVMLCEYNMTRCLFSGKIINESDEVVLIFSENFIKAKVGLELCVVKFIPEDIEKIDFWLLLLSKAYCPKSENLHNYMEFLDASGIVYIKQGVSGSWIAGGWAYVREQTFFYWIQENDKIFNLDIRKILMLKKHDIPTSSWCNFVEHSTLGPILIAMDGSSLYIQSSHDKCTEFWYNLLQSKFLHNGSTLEENRLTSEDIPVIVDKCTKFISAYGLKQQGIYRKPGPIKESKALIESFNKNPHAVHLIPNNEESINAVADVLRSFFRHLNSPAIPLSAHEKLIEIMNFSDEVMKIRAYHDLLLTFPLVNFRTLKRLFGHLCEVASHSDRNKMTIENLAVTFGSTLFGMNKKYNLSLSYNFSNATQHVQVTKDLITHFYQIFEVSQEEISKSSKLEIVQEASEQCTKVIAQGLLVPIHMQMKDNKCFNIKSDLTTNEIIAFKVQKDNLISARPFEDYGLFEMIKGGQLERRIGANETLTSIVLQRWLEWEADSDFYILFKKDPYPFNSQNIRTFIEDIKIAEPSSKTFRSAKIRIEFRSKVVRYSKKMKRQDEWSLDEMIWFMGSESERSSPFPHSLTFFITTGFARTKFNKTKFPGYCICFKDEIQRYQWLNSIILYKQEYLSAPLIQI